MHWSADLLPRPAKQDFLSKSNLVKPLAGSPVSACSVNRNTCICSHDPRLPWPATAAYRSPFTVHTTAASIHPRLLQKARAHSHYQAVWPCSKIASPSSSTHTFALRSRIFTTQPRLCFLSRITQHSCVIVIQATKLKDGTFHHHNSPINLIPLFRNT